MSGRIEKTISADRITFYQGPKRKKDLSTVSFSAFDKNSVLAKLLCRRFSYPV